MRVKERNDADGSSGGKKSMSLGTALKFTLGVVVLGAAGYAIWKQCETSTVQYGGDGHGQVCEGGHDCHEREFEGEHEFEDGHGPVHDQDPDGQYQDPDARRTERKLGDEHEETTQEFETGHGGSSPRQYFEAEDEETLQELNAGHETSPLRHYFEAEELETPLPHPWTDPSLDAEGNPYNPPLVPGGVPQRSFCDKNCNRLASARDGRGEEWSTCCRVCKLHEGPVDQVDHEWHCNHRDTKFVQAIKQFASRGGLPPADPVRWYRHYLNQQRAPAAGQQPYSRREEKIQRCVAFLCDPNNTALSAHTLEQQKLFLWKMGATFEEINDAIHRANLG